uniref:Uncharacterized protein n=1 Tax=Arundo donax TaxID=35708 RepID=A0A0A9E7E1_ARUDO
MLCSPIPCGSRALSDPSRIDP